MDREDLQDILETIVDNVYFQPPESVKLVYPCIVYSRSSINTKFANDLPYKTKTRYSVTLIDKNPDSIYVVELAGLPMCTHERHFRKDNLNHDIFNLYF